MSWIDTHRFEGLAALARKTSSGQITSEALTNAYFDAIERYDGKLHAFLATDRDGALEQAVNIDKRRKKGEALGPLAGVPIALKDNLVTRGLETNAGSKILAGWKPPFDSTVAQRLRAADAVILGKLNMDEFAMGSSCENSAYHASLNPWDPKRVPGGSSGGAAVAVAAGLCAGALGTDTGGSIRQPAALCGVSGLKPSYGRVSRYGVIAFASSLDQVGPLARHVEDCALLLQVISGVDPLDATSCQLAPPQGETSWLAASKIRDLHEVRIGVPRDFFEQDGLEKEVKDAVLTALETLREQGAELVDISLPHARYAIAAYYLIATAEASSNLSRYDGVRFGFRTDSATSLEEMYTRTRQEGFGEEVKRRIMLGTFALSAGYYDAYYGRAQRARELIRKDYAEAFQACDLIATPTSPCTAFRLGEKISDPLQMYLADIYTISCNLAELPGLSIPCGFSTRSLPIGLQLLAPRFAEHHLFRAGAAFQAHTDWHLRIPEHSRISERDEEVREADGPSELNGAGPEHDRSGEVSQ